jgi:hypothetical protein
MIRSLFFGSLAMLAAVMLIAMPASALDREVGLYSAGADPLDCPLIVSVKPDAVIVDEFQPLVRSQHDAQRRLHPTEPADHHLALCRRCIFAHRSAHSAGLTY